MLYLERRILYILWGQRNRLKPHFKKHRRNVKTPNSTQFHLFWKNKASFKRFEGIHLKFIWLRHTASPIVSLKWLQLIGQHESMQSQIIKTKVNWNHFSVYSLPTTSHCIQNKSQLQIGVTMSFKIWSAIHPWSSTHETLSFIH